MGNVFLSLNESFWTDGIFQNTRWAKIGWGGCRFLIDLLVIKKKLPDLERDIPSERDEVKQKLCSKDIKFCTKSETMCFI